MIPLTKFLSKNFNSNVFGSDVRKIQSITLPKRYFAKKINVAIPNKRLIVNPDIVPEEIIERLQQTAEPTKPPQEKETEQVDEEELTPEEKKVKKKLKEKEKPKLRFDPEAVGKWKIAWQKWLSLPTNFSRLSISTLTSGTIPLKHS
jgi:hypothetical protein